MKKLVLGLFVVFALSASAQIESGKLFVGGQVGFGTTGGSTEGIVAGTSTTTDGVKTFSFTLMPQIGYMVTENIGAGLGIGYTSTKTTTPNALGAGANVFDQVSKSGTFVIAPFARYYKSVSEKFYLFGEFGLPIAMTNTKSLQLNSAGTGTEDFDGVQKNSSFGFDLGLGANYFVTSNIALEARFNLFGIAYNSTKVTNTDKDGKNGTITKTSSFDFDFDTENVFNTGAIAVGVKIFI